MERCLSSRLEPTEAAFLRVRKQARRLITLGVKAGKPWDRATTISAVAAAVKMEPAYVLYLIHQHGWLLSFTIEKLVPYREWFVFEDGE